MNDKFIYRVGEELTQAEQLKNSKLLLRLFKERVTPEMVDLDTWTCGSTACIGGHVGSWSEFKELPYSGRSEDGIPRLYTTHRRVAFIDGVGTALFGENPWEQIFDASDDLPRHQHYDVAINRLKRHIQWLEQ